MAVPTDPVKYERWRYNNKAAMQKRAQDPVWLHKQAERNRLRSQDSKWHDNLKRAMQKRAQDPVWLRGNRERCQKRSQNPEWVRKNKIVGLNNSQNPEYRRKHKITMQKLTQDLEWRLKQKEGKVGGFWYGNVRYSDPPRYCELWRQDLWRRIDKAQNYQCQSGQIHVVYFHFP